jgi:hypothetical protein
MTYYFRYYLILYSIKDDRVFTDSGIINSPSSDILEGLLSLREKIARWYPGDEYICSHIELDEA